MSIEQINKKRTLFSEEEIEWLRKQEPKEYRQSLRRIKEYIDYDERYHDYFEEELKSQYMENYKRWMTILKHDRERMDDAQWESRKREVNIMIEEGILGNYITNIIAYIENNT